MSFTKCLVLLLSLSAPLATLATPHQVIRGIHHRRALAARVASPAPVPNVPFTPIAKRSINRRCKPRTTHATSASAAVVPTAVANVAPTPPPEEPTPTPTSTKAQETSTKAAPPPPPPSPTQKAPKPDPAPEQGSGGGSAPDGFMDGENTGEGTFYNTGLTACGIQNNDSQYIVAVSRLLFDSYPGYNGVNPNNNPICNKGIVVNFGGKSITVKVTDRCEACAMADLDFTPTAFSQIADMSLGRIRGVKWHWA